MAKLSKAKSAFGGKKVIKKKRSTQSKTVSFFIGVVTVILFALLVFQYAQQNNYKTVLGEKTKIERQDSKIK